MKVLIFQLVLSSMLMCTSCAESNSQSNTQSGSLSSENLKKADMNWSVITAGNQCGIEEPKQVIIQTQEAFDSLWQSCFQNMPAPIAKPTIDFSKEWVMAYFQGYTKSGGHNLTIDSITPSEIGAKVAITHKKPGKNCVSTMAVEFPYVLARIEHFKPIKAEYKVTEKEVDCN